MQPQHINGSHLSPITRWKAWLMLSGNIILHDGYNATSLADA
jgi:hypothetical protein